MTKSNFRKLLKCKDVFYGKGKKTEHATKVKARRYEIMWHEWCVLWLEV